MDTASNLINRTTEKLVHYILDNNVCAGGKLPNELELSRLFGVGRSTVREAVKALVGRNILTVKHGAGTFVACKQIGVTDDPLGFAFIKDKKKLISDLIEMRMVIEPRIAALAATGASAKDIAEMRVLAKDVETLMNSGEDHMQKDIELHTKIAQSSGNLIVPNLMPIIQRAILLFASTTEKKLRYETINTHKLIVDAIENRDSIAAADAMILHIAHNRDRIRRFFIEIETEIKEEPAPPVNQVNNG
ncbi:MAG: FCD domain-containing protein [Endomicrobium sp.]|nr:FCD domain-containing protein [Endomicrobium sp.]